MLKGLSAGYHGRAVVRDINLTVGAGEVVALLGSNGAGKTTTLLSISGLLPVMAGSIDVLGAPRGHRRKAHLLCRRGFAHVPQDRALFPKLTVLQHLRLAHGYGEGARRRIMEMFPALEPLQGRSAGLLSGGEQQMLAMGRALISRPKVLVVDEMSTGLAPLVVETLLATVRTLADEDGVAVLLVEQHVESALAVADRAMVMTHGQITLQGSTAEILADRDRLESSYLGHVAAVHTFLDDERARTGGPMQPSARA